MELKVWVDGIQRVVCGATLDTTCQDVVIALAHAMGRTGRFTLMEKFRDNDRPLTPTECPLRVLHKWGEYAAEVRFVLCQAETAQHKRQSQDKLSKKLSGSGSVGLKDSRDRTFLHSFNTAPPQPHNSEATVKRSLTFSGAHNHVPDDPAFLSSSQPTSKLRKTHMGPVPNGDVRRPMGPPLHPPPTSNTFQRQTNEGPRRTVQPSPSSQHKTFQPASSSDQQRVSPMSSSSGQERTMPPVSASSNQRTVPPSSSSQQKAIPPSSSSALHQQQQQQQHPVPPPRHRGTPSPRQQAAGGQNSSAKPVPQSSALQASTHHEGSGVRAQSVMPPQSSSQQPVPAVRPSSLPSSQTQSHQVHRPQPQRHPAAQSQSSSLHPSISPRSQQQHEQASSGTSTVQSQIQRLQPSHPHPAQPSSQRDKSPDPPPLPTSPPPSLPSRNPPSSASDHHQTLATIEASMLASDHSRQASLEIEEYDLDRNFPDSHQSSNNRGGGGDRPPMSLEYRLEDGGLGPSGGPSGGGGLQQRHQMEGEHAKLVRLVNMQQERLKTQESQLSLVNTEISAMEEKEKEYEEKLHVVMEELLLQETRQGDLELELTELEKVEWENVLDGEQKCESDLKRQIASLKVKVEEHEHSIEDASTKEAKLLEELREEEKKLEEEKERLKAEEAKYKEQEAKTREEITNLQSQFSELVKKSEACKFSLSEVNADITSVEEKVKEKEKELHNLEVTLKEENLKDLSAQSVPTEENKNKKEGAKDSGETIIKILEGRLSPRPAPTTTTSTTTIPKKVTPGTSSTPPFIASLAPKNPSGVFV